MGGGCNMEKREAAARFAVYYEGNWKQIRDALASEKRPPDVEPKDKWISFWDSEYPECLRQLQCPPWVLFYEGDLTLLQRRKAAIVGSRRMTYYGAELTGIAADILKEEFVIVSGLAKGVDAEAHRHALAGGKTIAVIGSGLAWKYPTCNRELYQRIREDGLIISEFPHDTPVRRYHFPWRNRIIAGLCEVVVVTQAALKSGTMYTVSEALELGRDICCMPYPFEAPEGELCSLLVQEGASLLFTRREIEEICSRK